jgi:cytochrome c-type biogenesis protein CcmE
MNNIQKRRLYYICIFITGIAIASGLIFYSLRQNMNVFLTPHQLNTMHVAPDYHIRLGGMVKEHSVTHGNQDLSVNFIVTDFKNEIPVHYVGVLPDLFHEGKGVIAEGTLNNGIFNATQILAKHDENYMPKSVYEQMRKAN